MTGNKNTLLRLLLLLFAAAMFGLAVTGTVLNFSPVPFWDMWGGVYEFIFRVQDGDYSAWWGFHNEHRIILARIFFWLDYAWFGNLGISLQVVNYLIVIAGCVVFWQFIQRVSSDEEKRSGRTVLLGLFITGWMFLWSQKENLTWGFQPQFFLAQLLPLAAFYCLASASRARSDAQFILACLWGVLSAVTMANGVLALPLVFIMACLLPFSVRQRMVLLALSVAVPVLYFMGFETPGGHGSLSKTLMEDPVGMVRYTMVYLGGPARFLLVKQKWGLQAAEIAGFIFTFVTLLVTGLSLLRRPLQAHVLALLFFIVYVAGSGFGTAGGRLNFGLAQALAERYTTPSVMAWAALFIICMSLIRSRPGRRSVGVVVLGVVFCLLTLNVQFKALRPDRDVLLARDVGAMALTLKVADKHYTDQLFPSVPFLQSVTEKSRERHTGFLTAYPFVGMAESMGTAVSTRAASQCAGQLDFVEPIAGVPDFLRVGGWVFDTDRKQVPRRLHFVDESGKVVGYALTGQPRKDIKREQGKHAALSGFIGYLHPVAAGSVVTVLTDDDSCSVRIQVAKPAYRLVLPQENRAPTVTAHAVQDVQTFNGGNVKDKVPAGMKDFSSYVNGDQDVGSITLLVRNGDRLLFRTGPSPGGMYLKAAGSVSALPVSGEWSQLEFTDLPAPGENLVTFEDAGSAWGQWLAIAVLEQ